MTSAKCFLCDASAISSETEANFIRYRCEGPCKRYVISCGAKGHIESSVASVAMKQAFSTEAARAQSAGMILLVKHDAKGQFERVRIPESHPLWSAPWATS
jgi:hypothetical protein